MITAQKFGQVANSFSQQMFQTEEMSFSQTGRQNVCLLPKYFTARFKHFDVSIIVDPKPFSWRKKPTEIRELKNMHVGAAIEI